MRDSEPIAIIGFAGRFPGANNVQEFWKMLCQGREGVRQWGTGLATVAQDGPLHVNAWGLLENIDLFDADYFGISPREAMLMDPQHRIALECAMEALEHAGHDPDRFAGRIGIYVGASTNTYQQLLLRVPEGKEANPQMLAINNERDFLATRISYKLGLRGESIMVQTACSTSLVAVHLACRSLRNRDLEMALAGGVSVNACQDEGYVAIDGGPTSPDGHCRAFDERAQGVPPGSGAALVVLKRLSSATVDGDTVYAVVRGSAVNNDGSEKIGYSAPGISGQSAVLLAAWRDAGLDPHTAGLIEAHGTGTPLGDSVEIAALREVFEANGARPHTCVLSAVKSSIGHLDVAAGVAGLIKAALCLYYGEVPPAVNFSRPNPSLQLEETPFWINTRRYPWKERAKSPLRAGASSFGIGGTNAHVVMEEGPAVKTDVATILPRLLMLSARTATALESAIQRLGQWVADRQERNLRDVAFTLQAGRREFSHRATWMCSEGITTSALQAGFWEKSVVLDRPPSITFYFPEQDDSFQLAGRDLYRSHSRFRQTIDHFVSAALLRGIDLRPLFGDGDCPLEEGPKLRIIGLIIFQIGLAALWRHWGVKPEGYRAHGIGKIAANRYDGKWKNEADILEVIEKEWQSGNLLRLVSDHTDSGGRRDSEAAQNNIELYLSSRHLVIGSSGPAEKIRPPERDVPRHVLQAAGDLWRAGIPLNYVSMWEDERPHRIEIPGYAFERQRFWVSSVNEGSEKKTSIDGSRTIGQFTKPELPYATGIGNGTAAESLADEVRHLVADFLGVPAVQSSDELFDLGIDSLHSMELTVKINERFNVRLPTIITTSGLTISGLTEQVRHASESGDRNPAHLVKIKDGRERTTLFLVHPVSGSLNLYSPLAGAQQIHQEIYGIASGLREAAHRTSIEEIAAAYLLLMRAYQPQGPYLLGGHSMGGLIAYEMARQLLASGDHVSHLLLIDAWPGNLSSVVAATNGTPRGLALGSETCEKAQTRTLAEAIFHRVTEGRFLGKKSSGLLRDILEAQLHAIEQYRPEPYPGSVILIQSDWAPELKEMAKTRWAGLVGKLHVHQADGDHFTMWQSPHAESLCDLIASSLQFD